MGAGNCSPCKAGCSGLKCFHISVFSRTDLRFTALQLSLYLHVQRSKALEAKTMPSHQGEKHFPHERQGAAHRNQNTTPGQGWLCSPAALFFGKIWTTFKGSSPERRAHNHSWGGMSLSPSSHMPWAPWPVRPHCPAHNAHKCPSDSGIKVIPQYCSSPTLNLLAAMDSSPRLLPGKWVQFSILAPCWQLLCVFLHGRHCTEPSIWRTQWQSSGADNVALLMPKGSSNRFVLRASNALKQRCLLLAGQRH